MKPAEQIAKSASTPPFMGARALPSSRSTFAVVLAMVCAVLALGAASASAHIAYTFTSSFGSAGGSAGGLSGPKGVAIDQETGDVYVADTGNNRVDEFSSTGAFILAFGKEVDKTTKGNVCTAVSGDTCQAGASGIKPGELEAPTFVAVDNDLLSPSHGDVYVAARGHEGESPGYLVTKFDSEGKLVESWGDNGPGEGPDGQLRGKPAEPKGCALPVEPCSPAVPFGAVNGIAVDATGNLWAFIQGTVGAPGGHMYEFEQGGGFMQSSYPGTESADGIALDSSGGLYINESNRVVKVGVGEVTYSQFVSISGLAVDPVDSEIYVDLSGSIERFDSSCKPAGGNACAVAETFGAPQSLGGAGVAVDSATGQVYVANPGSDGVAVFTPEVPEAPTVEEQSVSFVTAGSATFSATIDPRGPETEYHFEYGPTASYGETVPIPDSVVGSGFKVQEVAGEHVQALQAHTTYHFRVVAHNQKGTTYGQDQTFLTQQTTGGGSVLADGRQWELVTPPDKQGALFSPITENGAIQASADGNAIVGLASRPPEAEPQGYANEVSVLSTRGAADWSSQAISPSHTVATGYAGAGGTEYTLFSEDLSRGVIHPDGNFDQLSPEATENTPYLRTDYLNGNVGEHCLTSCFQPLVTAANTLPGAAFGEEPNGLCIDHDQCGPHVEAASPDLSHIVFYSPVQLTSTPGSGMYEWSAGQLQLIGVGGEASLKVAGGSKTGNGALENSARHAVSDDGRVIMEVPQGPLSLYDPEAHTTIQIGTGAYQTANSEASKIFFLSAAAGENLLQEGGDLYEYNLNAPLASRLTDLTIDQNAGEQAHVKKVIGASEDGSYVYFAAGGVLAEGAVPGECQEGNAPRKDGCNLYVYHDGATRLIATLSSREDVSDWLKNLNDLPARVSPNGRWLAFMSSKDLTGYDTRDAISGHPDQEVYLYDADSNRLVCASCNPTGTRPVGAQLAGLVKDGLEGKWAAANVPPWTGIEQNLTRYQSRYLSDSGRLFFDSHDALVPQDVNGTEDVYQYEPPGVGSCSLSSVTFGERSDGCVGLISSGTSPEESAFLDASETGGDVFFLTTAKLAPQDYDDAFDVYDAHECTPTSTCFPTPAAQVPPCTTEASCKASPAPQPSVFGLPASATFSGVGNVTPPPAAVKKVTKKTVKCKKNFVKNKKGKCIKSKRKKTKAKKANNRRRAK